MCWSNADDNSWGNALFFSEQPDDALATWLRGDRLFPRRLGNEKNGFPFIGIYLLPSVVPVGFVDENAFLAVKQDMRCFMEEVEPEEVIIGLVSGGQLDDGLPRRQPTSGVTERCLLQRLHQRQRNTCLVS